MFGIQTTVELRSISGNVAKYTYIAPNLFSVATEHYVRPTISQQTSCSHWMN